MEIIRGGELLDLLIDGGVYTEKDAARCMKQVFLAISYLHSQGIVHRDLKLQNLLLTEKDRNSDIKVTRRGPSYLPSARLWPLVPSFTAHPTRCLRSRAVRSGPDLDIAQVPPSQGKPPPHPVPSFTGGRFWAFRNPAARRV